MLRPSATNLSCDTRHRLAGLLSILRVKADQKYAYYSTAGMLP
jgi:hypothetical protein